MKKFSSSFHVRSRNAPHPRTARQETTMWIIIRCKFFFLFIGWKPTTWPANNCLQVMVCSCAVSPTVFAAELCVNETTRGTFLREKKGRSLHFPKIFIKKKTWWPNDETIIELGYHKISWFASVSHISYQDLLATDKSLYFAQHRPIIVLWYL